MQDEIRQALRHLITHAPHRDVRRFAAHGSMQDEIQRALTPLVGLPLTDMWRYVGLQKFEFGSQRPHKNNKGEKVTWADWGLVVACDWRITGPVGPIVWSHDFGPGTRRRDEAASPFDATLGKTPPTIESIEATEGGNVHIRMAGGYILEVLTNAVADEEQWRLMPKDGRRKHFVVTREGIER